MVAIAFDQECSMSDEGQQTGLLVAVTGVLVGFFAWLRQRVSSAASGVREDTKISTKLLDRITALEARLDTVEQEADTCQRQYTALLAQHTILNGKVDNLTTENNSLRTINNGLREEIAELRRSLV